MNKIKVLLIQNYIAHYNLPIYKLLSLQQGLDLTILHFGEKVDTGNIGQILFPVKKFLKLYFFFKSISKICNKYDVVISLADMHYPQLMLLSIFREKKFKLIYWTIGVSASYTKRYDEIQKWDFIRHFFYKKSDALLFYSDYPIKKYISSGFSREKLFVANNTLEVNENEYRIREKRSILFIGTLYAEKGIYDLLETYNQIIKDDISFYPLNIIGGGTEYEKISEWIESEHLASKIHLIGPVYDETILSEFFYDAIACISPNQAGLSVLKSMGYGVPFITSKDAITGGELFNIVNNENGVLYSSNEELYGILERLKREKIAFIKMGEKAYQHYHNFRKPIHMVNGFREAIDFVLEKHYFKK